MPTDEERRIVAGCLMYITGLRYKNAWDFWMKLDKEKQDAVVSMCVLTTDVEGRALLGVSLSDKEWPPQIKRLKVTIKRPQ